MRSFCLWLWYLMPANPIVVRTLQGASLRQRHLWVRMFYLGALIGLVTVGLLIEGGMNANVNLSDLAKSGTKLFAFVSYAQVASICLLAPLFLAGAIAQEQTGRTYEILLTTPLSNLQIVLGSLLGRLFFVLALLLSGLPLFSVLMIFGGVPVRSVFVAFAVAALVALMVGAVAVTLSVLRAGGRKAVFVFIVAVAGYLVAAYVVDVRLLRNPASNTTTWLTPLHPLLVLESYLSSAKYQPPSPETLAGQPAVIRFYLSQPLGAFSVLTMSISFVLILWSTIYARRIVALSGTVGWVRRTLRLGMGGGGERRHPPRTVRGNPIAWREAHTRGNHAVNIVGRWGFLTLTLGAMTAFLIAYHLGHLSANALRTTMVTLLLLELAVVAMVAIFMSAGACSGEREDGTLDLILTTPVTQKDYIWGKLRGLVRFLSLLIAAPILTLALVAAYAQIGAMLQSPKAMVTDAIPGAAAGARHILILPETPLLMALILIPFVALCVIVGMNWSLKSNGVLSAVVPTLAIIAAVSLVLGFCGLQMANSVPVIGPIVNSFSPTTSVITLIYPWGFIHGFAGQTGVNRALLLVAAVIAAGGYSVIVYSMLLNMVRHFDQTVRKLSGGR